VVAVIGAVLVVVQAAGPACAQPVTVPGPDFDLVPTILDVLGVEPPATIKGRFQSPFDGVSMRE
jgi:arylsulfatase